MVFKDEANDIEGWYELGNCGRKKHQDFFKGEIKVRGIKVSDIYGSYMGFFDIDGKRYWDIRRADDFHMPHRAVGSRALMSDSLRREDARTLESKDYDKAQELKYAYEELQRNDRRLREEAEKRRANGGPQIQFSYKK